MYKHQITPRISFLQLLIYDRPSATAWVTGGKDYPSISGLTKFYQTPYDGILIEAEFFNLPNQNAEGSSDFYAMHIHEFGDCSNSFEKTGAHYNPDFALHPNHAGDMPPLLSNQGYAYSVFYDKRFTLAEIIGKSVIIHSKADDFTTQPSGNAGVKIACGEIMRTI